jgi:hypothetical protein
MRSIPGFDLIEVTIVSLTVGVEIKLNLAVEDFASLVACKLKFFSDEEPRDGQLLLLDGGQPVWASFFFLWGFLGGWHGVGGGWGISIFHCVVFVGVVCAKRW